MKLVRGSLVIVGANTPNCEVYFNGTQIPGLLDLNINWDDNSSFTKLKVIAGLDSTLKEELELANIIVREKTV